MRLQRGYCTEALAAICLDSLPSSHSWLVSKPGVLPQSQRAQLSQDQLRGIGNSGEPCRERRGNPPPFPARLTRPESRGRHPPRPRCQERMLLQIQQQEATLPRVMTGKTAGRYTMGQSRCWVDCLVDSLTSDRSPVKLFDVLIMQTSPIIELIKTLVYGWFNVNDAGLTLSQLQLTLN